MVEMEKLREKELVAAKVALFGFHQLKPERKQVEGEGNRRPGENFEQVEGEGGKRQWEEQLAEVEKSQMKNVVKRDTNWNKEMKSFRE